MNSTKLLSQHMGEILKEKMISSSSSVSSLAEFLGYKDRHQVYYLYKKDDFRFSELIKVCTFLQISIEEFLGDALLEALADDETTVIRQMERRLTNLENYVRQIEKRIETS